VRRFSAMSQACWKMNSSVNNIPLVIISASKRCCPGLRWAVPIKYAPLKGPAPFRDRVPVLPMMVGTTRASWTTFPAGAGLMLLRGPAGSLVPVPATITPQGPGRNCTP